MHSSGIGEYGVLTAECMEAIAVPTMVGANKINATLKQQTPEVYSCWESALTRVKSQWKAEFMAEFMNEGIKNATSEKKSNVSVSLGSEDEMIIKIIKRPRTEDFVATAASSVNIGATV
eukprot:6369373-Amphidinium_carterae.1